MCVTWPPRPNSAGSAGASCRCSRRRVTAAAPTSRAWRCYVTPAFACSACPTDAHQPLSSEPWEAINFILGAYAARTVSIMFNI
ncbi:jg3971 [Pararge aegeria aegeria]|uniref:Jg3971 protein n=1 Tax=Pararge aegeria aegeria TaxID=348720 RepID=A0A8S4RWI2_9NEOP|nr:jg3971 [Pararge aegeria aegeria]